MVGQCSSPLGQTCEQTSGTTDTNSSTPPPILTQPSSSQATSSTRLSLRRPTNLCQQTLISLRVAGCSSTQRTNRSYLYEDLSQQYTARLSSTSLMKNNKKNWYTSFLLSFPLSLAASSWAVTSLLNRKVSERRRALQGTTPCFAIIQRVGRNCGIRYSKEEPILLLRQTSWRSREMTNSQLVWTIQESIGSCDGSSRDFKIIFSLVKENGIINNKNYFLDVLISSERMVERCSPMAKTAPA